MSKKVTLKNLKKNIGKCVRTSSGSLLKLFITEQGTPTIVWLEMKKEERGWKVTYDTDFIGAEKFIKKPTKAFYIDTICDFKEIFGDEPAYYVDEEPKTKKIFANTLSTEEVIERLQNGEELKTEYGRTVKFVKGVLCGIENDSVQINAGATIDKTDDYYFDEEVKKEPFKITEAGFYKTRGGSKVYVSVVEPIFKFGIFGVFVGSSQTNTWQENGSALVDERESLDDIVSKWEE